MQQPKLQRMVVTGERRSWPALDTLLPELQKESMDTVKKPTRSAQSLIKLLRYYYSDQDITDLCDIAEQALAQVDVLTAQRASTVQALKIVQEYLQKAAQHMPSVDL